MNYTDQIAKIKVNKSGQTISLHKPILLLLTISEIFHNKNNLFKYSEIESSLIELLKKYGLKNTKKLNPQYPFIYLNSSPEIWQCSIQKSSLKNPDAASRNELLNESAKFSEGFYNYISNSENAMQIVSQLLNEYWAEAYHEEILSDLRLDSVLNNSIMEQKNEKRRGKLFVEEVLDAYERQCAICRQSIRLGDSLLGIDACHIKPIQHFGPDIISNGVALCKLHHWALDRGAISFSKELKVQVSNKLNGSKSDLFFHNFSEIELFVPRNQGKELSIEFINYHYDFIFCK